MKVQVEDVSPVEKRLSIEVEPGMVEQELVRAYSELAHQVRVPGFRQGKVPRRILEQRYKAEVEADVVKRVQVRAFLEAVREKHLPAVSDPHLSGGTIEAHKPFAFTARVEVKPQIVPRDYKGLVLRRFSAEVSDEAVKEQLAKLQESRTTLEKLEGREVAQEGDWALVDFDATKEGLPFPGSTGRNVSVHIGPGELIRGELPQLAGLQVGQERGFDYTFPGDFQVESLRGQSARFVVTLRELRAKRVPALDDAFAQSAGAESLEALTATMRSDLERAAARDAARNEREEVINKLIEKNAFEVPGTLVDRGIDHMLGSALESVQRSGVDVGSLKMDFRGLREELRPKSLAEVKGQLLLEAIVKAESIEVSQADVEAEIEGIAAETGGSLAMVRKHFRSEEGQASLNSRALENKAMAFLKSHATYQP